MKENLKKQLEENQKAIRNALEMLENADSSLDVKNMATLIKEHYAENKTLVEAICQINKDEEDKKFRDRELEFKERELAQIRELEEAKLLHELTIHKDDEFLRKVSIGVDVGKLFIESGLIIFSLGLVVVASNDGTADLQMSRGVVDLARGFINKHIG